MKEYTPHEIAKKKLELEGLSACVIDDLLKAMTGLQPTRMHYRYGDSGLNQMILPLSTTGNAESTVISIGAGWCLSRICETKIDEGKAETHYVDLSDQEMDTICALWLQYKLEKLSEK